MVFSSFSEEELPPCSAALTVPPAMTPSSHSTSSPHTYLGIAMAPLVLIDQGGGGVPLSTSSPALKQFWVASPTSPTKRRAASPSLAPPLLESEPPTMLSLGKTLAFHRSASPTPPAPAPSRDGIVIGKCPHSHGSAWFMAPPPWDIVKKRDSCKPVFTRHQLQGLANFVQSLTSRSTGLRTQSLGSVFSFGPMSSRWPLLTSHSL